MSKFKTVCGVIAFVLFFLMLGAVGAIEQDIVPLFPGMVRVFALMALWVLFCNLAGAKTLSPVQVGQVVKALVLLGARKIIVEEVEKDRFVVTTTTETAHSKKN